MTYEKLKPPNLIEATGQGYRGIHTLYKLSEPLKYKEVSSVRFEYNDGETEYVLVSSTTLLGEDVTVIFPASANGKVLSFITEMRKHGTHNHDHMMHIYFGGDDD